MVAIFADDISKCIFVHENLFILIHISLKFVPKFPINTNPSLVQKMARRWAGVGVEHTAFGISIIIFLFK